MLHDGSREASPNGLDDKTLISEQSPAANVGAIPIGENDRFVGMVTDRDIVCKGLAHDNFDASALPPAT